MKKSIFRMITPVFLGLAMLTSCGNEQNSGNNETKTEFTVYGNCGMCEKTIEGSLNGQNGIHEADWNKDTKMITVTYDPNVLDENRIKEKIAGVGYDTDSHKAKDEVYNALPDCCQYNRP